MVAILMILAKLTTLGLLKIKVFWNKGYDIVISFHDVTKKILSRNSNYIVGKVTRPKFGNSSISMREVIITSILQGLTRKTTFFDGWFWFKFNNLGPAQGMPLKFYTSVEKGLKLNIRKFWELTLRL